MILACKFCGTKFNGHPPAKYCSDDCRAAVRRIREHDRFQKEKHEKAMQKKVNLLDQTLAYCKANGIEYAERQKQRTLMMIKSGLV